MVITFVVYFYHRVVEFNLTREKKEMGGNKKKIKEISVPEFH